MSPCKLCHGPLAAAPAAGQVNCHANCLPFACPLCVSSDKPSFSILNLNNHIYDYTCTECMAESASSKPLTTTTTASFMKSHAHTHTHGSDGHAIC
ncbi:hypothetical protein I316_00160 [Kwoniella heveanensis BCC8398]|uniref:Uncharacterized protein n=1 Tax=Kwoniella heveanensis BCC8398 TaxID=1296120 RepID=A0A1B9H3T9_9TREE|nr:hypothetical protein I316_00160 [Kwoniella heveanensis BCC8398]